MRNIVFLLTVLFIAFFSSCDYDNFFSNKVGPGISKTVVDTFTYFCTEPVLEDRYDCHLNPLPEPKVTEWKTVEKKISQEVLLLFSDQELRNIGYLYAGKDPLYTEGMGPLWDLLGWITLIILVILLLWLLLWLLRRLPDWWNQTRNNNQNQEGILRDRTTGQPIGGVGQNTPVNQPVATTPNGTWVPEGYNLVKTGMVLIEANSIYLGTRQGGENLIAEIYTPASQPPPETPNEPEQKKDIL